MSKTLIVCYCEPDKASLNWQLLLKAGCDLLGHPVETPSHARETLEALAGRYRIILITKGDLFDQERKLAQSGLGEPFDADDPRRGSRAQHDGRQLAQVRRGAGARGGQLGRPRAA